MKRLLAVLLILNASTALATTYYVDSVGGDDGNSGTSPGAAWQNLTKVSTVTFSAGDQILLKAGSVWNSQQLWPKGSGSAGNPIVIDKYGVGSLPLLNGQGAVTDVVYLYNQEYWDVNNLEITNYRSGDDPDDPANLRRGVYVQADDAGEINHIYLQNLEVHDVSGTYETKHNGGIFLEVTGNTTETYFNDVLIDGCYVHDVNRTGVSNLSSWWRRLPEDPNWVPSQNFVMKNTIIERAAYNGAIIRCVDGALIEYCTFKDNGRYGNGNAIFIFNTDNSVIQYCEGYGTFYNSGDHDAAGFDSDGRNKSSKIQYCYSHDNGLGGIVMAVGDGFTPEQRFNTNTKIRYNIIENCLQHGFRLSGTPTDTMIYNNVVYIGPELSDIKIIFHKGWNGAPANISYLNNIFYNLGSGCYYDFAASTNNTLDHNLFFGNHPATEPADANKITTDPKLVAPGTGGVGRDTVDGYKLKSGSPCIDAGIDIPNNGGLDYWGNVVPQNAATDIGAYESPWNRSPAYLDGDNIIDYNDLKIICDNWLDNFPAADITPDGAPDGIVNFLDYAGPAADWDWPDYDAPTPDQMLWQDGPNSISSSEITMTAQVANDKSGVQYYFANVTDPNHDSGWQPDTGYNDTGLSPETQYTYMVKARDNSPYYNETAYSVTASDTTWNSSQDRITIFADGFEDCFDNWTSTGWCSVTRYEGAKSCKMENTEYAETNVSTSGYNSISVKYARKLDEMVAGQQFLSRWYDGTSWHIIEDLTNPAEFTTWTLVEFYLAGTADNNPDLKIRFEVDNSSSESGFVDAVEILGTAE